MAVVLLFKFPDGNERFVPVNGEIVFGRSKSCDVTFEDSKISSKHAIFLLTTSGELQFKDLGSRNGSYLNGNLINNSLVRINDEIIICNVKISINQLKLTSSESKIIGLNKRNKELTLPVLKTKK